MIRFLLITMFLIMFTLKLCGVIALSWWWVTAPLWVPLVLLILCMTLVGFLAILAHIKDQK